MKFIYVPQLSDKQIEYTFEDEKIIVHLDGYTDTFDFTGLPDGRLELIDEESGKLLIETSLPINPIIGAWKEDGILHLKLLNYINDEATEEERFPSWQEVN
ncbi:hypothetical protein BH753_gp137 [Bacillus phage Shbh1]|uniref:Uncharacterized protein n=1 Tax=Bacillus phage Shbh1 TaxID=1796992 RepID=A0A142F1G2_9CAUD|nr:hypothetical protein BH753_gp137 [Bacillus phage Shbh1]AMQ66619.1 hypothetical protein [Bacillus phage Shbh1]